MSHVVIKKSLAKALMDACVEDVSPQEPQKLGLGGLVKAISSPIGQILGGVYDGLNVDNKFNATDPAVGKQLELLRGQQGEVYSQQQNLAQTLLAQSQGQGPNPALQALQNQTGQNIQQQTAMMAGQRGASANPALLARQAAMQGANIQQQSVGQAALMQAQQQLQAQQLLQQQQSTMAGQALQGQGIYMGGQNVANQINAGVAGANQAQRAKVYGQLLQAGGSAMGGMGGGGAGAMGGGGGQMATGGPMAPGAMAPGMMVASQGGQVPGQPQVFGDSEANDTQPALLSPGEIVIPRTIAEHPNAPELAKSFVQHLMLQQRGYGGVIEARKKSGSAQKMWDGGVSGKDDLGVIDKPDPYGGSFSDRLGGLFSSEGRKDLGLTIEKQQNAPLEGTTPPPPVDMNLIESSMQPTALGNPQMAEAAATNTPMPDAQTSAPSPAATPAAPGMDFSKSIQGNIDQYSKGVKGEAEAVGKMQGEMGDVQQAHTDLLKQKQQIFDDEMLNLSAASQKLSQDIASSTVDPGRYWSNKSTGSKISTIAGVLLSGIGAGLDGTAKNMAWEALDKKVENDIQQQKIELGKKQTMFSDNLKQRGSLIDAENATRLQSYAILQGDLARIAAKSNNEIVKNQAMQKIAEYNDRMVPLQMFVAQSQSEMQLKKQLQDQMKNGGLSDMDPASLVPHFVPKEKQEEVFKEVERAKNTAAMTPKILEYFDMSTSKNPVVAARGRKAFEGLINTTVSDLTGTARQAEFDSIHKNFSSSGLTALPGENETMRKSLVNYLGGKSAAPRFKGYVGMDLDKFNSTASSKNDQFKVVNGVKYKRGPKGEAIPVK